MKPFITIFVLILGFGLGHAQIKEKKEYYSNGTLKHHSYYKTDSDGWPVREGKWKDYYDNGNLQYFTFYVKGKREGKEEKYYETGELESVESYKNGMSQNDEKTYYKNGKEVTAVKNSLGQKIKTKNVNAHFVQVDFPAERQSIQLFTNPLKVEGYYFSGLKFKVPEDGYLYWNFQLQKNNEVDNFYIVSADAEDHDLDKRYFTRMAFKISKDKDQFSDWIIQKSSEKLKANTEYVIYFKSKEVKPRPEKLTFELKLSATNDEKLGAFFKNSFEGGLLRDY
ncbi:toxin-antitoxin system YwqK family antitoxin [Chryseobacterium sp. MDT2-18]|uniref:toxin-antitoxin system YwqK family antitoxin n=1 Tax=Chryseobacterium sp. MDT2-18 TaxID=1259136 RepID=UPI00277FD358|nr:hypothetical protein [Chryseobacterium sp. MDT2-18]MDQ0477290.1 hypothetical protein [Chryseobacterium sp. MDT2-18]